MTFEQIKTFLVVANEGNFTRAARVLFLSQPAVSQHVLSLEKSLGLRLFDRKGRRVTVTLAGLRFLDYARLIINETDTLLADLQGLDAPLQGTVSIGAIHSVGIYTLPTQIAEFQAQYPSVRAELKTGSTEQIADELARGTIDLAIVDVELPPSTSRYIERLPLCTETYSLIVPPGHPWAGRTDLLGEEVYQQRFVMRERRSRSRALLEIELAKAHLEVGRLPISLELGSTEAIKQAVRSGLGVGFVPSSAVEQELKWGTLTTAELAAGALQRQLWLYSPVRQGLPRRIHVFRDYLLSRNGGSCATEPDSGFETPRSRPYRLDKKR